ncbi:hypothetical protein NOCA2690017 [metagenome]|uniref:Uncharacterized protein n=1 Tax=metagenome TaxID=256318 RepID=A0A2P2CFT7_9ZZZZ
MLRGRLHSGPVDSSMSVKQLLGLCFGPVWSFSRVR